VAYGFIPSAVMRGGGLGATAIPTAMTGTSAEQPDGRRQVLVYRDRIGVPSEIEFSRRQYVGFRSLRPVWIGRTLLPDAGRICPSPIRIGGLGGLLFRHFGLTPALDLSPFVSVVHAQFARGGALAVPLARAMGAKLVVTLHGGDVGKDKNWRHTMLAWRWPEVISRTHRFVCVSHAVAETALRRGTPKELLTVLPIGVEVPASAPVQPRERLFLFAGRFVEKKGITVLAEAMRMLRAGGDTTRLICAGDGPLRPVLERLAQDIPGVELTGWLSQQALAARMETALALVAPSMVAADGDAEGLPSVVPEAMARGCGVIGTDEGGIAEVVTNGSTGLLVPPGDAVSLAAAMHRLSSEPDLAARLAHAAFIDVGERLNALRQSAILETVLLEAAEGR
jgi:glycosyltransferase involved in cell wall biosynthesis